MDEKKNVITSFTDNNYNTIEEDYKKEAKDKPEKFRLTVEPLMLCVGFAMNFTSGITIDLFENYICQSVYNATQLECMNMTDEMKTVVDSKTAKLTVYTNSMEGTFPAIMSMFIGPWSDKNGRKPIIMLSLLGLFFNYLLYFLLSLFPRLPILVYLLPSAILSISGGVSVFTTSTASYICDISGSTDLSFRFAIKNGFMILGGVLGFSISTNAFKTSGPWKFQLLFIISSLVTLFALIYTICAIRETIIVKKGDYTKLFDLVHLKKVFKAIVVHPRKEQLVLALLVVCLLCEITSTLGETKIIYLIGKSQYNWSLGDYNHYMLTINILQALIPIILLWIFQSKLKVPKRIIMVVCSILLLLTTILKAISPSNLFFWISSALFSLGLPSASIWDDEFYCTLTIEESGTANALFAAMEVFAILVGPPMFMESYRYFLPNRTLYVYFLTSGVLLLPAIASICLFLIKS